MRMFMNLRAQAAEQIVDPARESRITAEQDFHAHRWRGEPGLLEHLMESQADLCVGAAAANRLVDNGGHGRPQRQARRQRQKWRVRDLLKCKDAARPNHLPEAPDNREGIWKKLKDEAAHDRVEGLSALHLRGVAFNESYVGQSRVSNPRPSPSN